MEKNKNQWAELLTYTTRGMLGYREFLAQQCPAANTACKTVHTCQLIQQRSVGIRTWAQQQNHINSNFSTIIIKQRQ
jgi:hypothetical protein